MDFPVSSLTAGDIKYPVAHLRIQYDTVVEVGSVDGHVLLYRIVLPAADLQRFDGELDLGEVEGRDEIVFPHLVREGGRVYPVRRATHHYQRLPSLKTVSHQNSSPTRIFQLTKSLSW